MFWVILGHFFSFSPPLNCPKTFHQIKLSKKKPSREYKFRIRYQALWLLDVLLLSFHWLSMDGGINRWTDQKTDRCRDGCTEIWHKSMSMTHNRICPNYFTESFQICVKDLCHIVCIPPSLLSMVEPPTKF